MSPKPSSPTNTGGEPNRPPELTAAQAAKSPLIRKIKSLDEFQPDQGALDEATSVGDDAVKAELRRQLGIKD